MRTSRARVIVSFFCAVMIFTSCSNESESPGDGGDNAASCPVADPADIATGITQDRAESLLGFSETDAQRCAEQLGWAFRVGRRDEEVFALTMDYSAQRVNVEVDDGVITLIGVG